MRIPSGTTDQYIYFVAVDSTDLKTRETGLTTFTVYRSRNGGIAAAMTTPTVNEVDATNMPGVYELLLDEDMTIDAGDDSQEMVFHITQASMAPVTRTIELYRSKITAGNTLTVDASGNVTLADSVTHGGSGAVMSLGSVVIAPSDGTPNIDLAGSGNADGITFTRSGSGNPFDTNVMAQINAEVDTAISDAALATAAALTTVDTNVDTILVDTNELQTDWADGGRLDLILDARASQTSVDTVDTNVDAILVDTGTTLPAQISGLNDPTAAAIADAVWDEATVGHTTAGTFGEQVKTDVDAILADTNELQGDWVNGGRLDVILDELTTQGDTNETKLDTIDTNVDAILVDTASIGITKNAAFSNFEFLMVLTSDHYTAGTGLTVTGQRSIDGGGFTNISGAIAEVGSGVYQVDLLAADTNGDVITYKFSAATADDTIVTVKTRA